MIALIDIETSGLDPCIHDVIEVGVAFAEHGHYIGEDEFSVPFNEELAEPRALEVNGWGKREFAVKIEPEEACTRMQEWWDHDDPIFCSWHVTLDECFLNQFFRRHTGQGPPWSYRKVVDLPSLVMGKMGVLTAGSSRELMVQLGIDPDFKDRHSALRDAQANFEVYEKLKLWEIT